MYDIDIEGVDEGPYHRDLGLVFLEKKIPVHVLGSLDDIQ